MKVVIIEDERLVADDLEENIGSLIPSPLAIVKLYTVKEAILWLKNNPAPDLIFSDIQLGDGLSFEVFAAVAITAPVIFCTAYDQYAIEAFKMNGINYILKPYSREMLETALNKYHQLKNLFTQTATIGYDALLEFMAMRETKGKTGSILVYHKDKIIPIKLEDIALFYLEKEIVHLLTFGGQVYYPNKTLDELEKAAGTSFFRASRQVLICRKAITDASSFFSRRLSLNLTVPFHDRITVSRGRTPAFLEWLTLD